MLANSFSTDQINWAEKILLEAGYYPNLVEKIINTLSSACIDEGALDSHQEKARIVSFDINTDLYSIEKQYDLLCQFNELMPDEIRLSNDVLSKVILDSKHIQSEEDLEILFVTFCDEGGKFDFQKTAEIGRAHV